MAKSKTIQILVLAAIMVIVLDIGTRVAAGDDDVTLTDRLAVQPVEDGVYILGNSMFKTGVDLAAMQGSISERDVRFNYYDGHYTSLWYLIAKGALGPAEEKPAIVVWGFRPRYALTPAFRQNRPNSTELFEFPDLTYYRMIGDSVATPLVDMQSFLQTWSGMFALRDEAKDAVAGSAERAGLELLLTVGQNVVGLWDRLINGESSIADEIVRAATQGEVQLTEEQVVDGVGDFIVGPTRSFADGFVPLTADVFQRYGIHQLVVIWRPVNVASGSPVPLEDQFVADAIEYFEANDIPYVDLYHDDRIELSYFASGDHYNADGRAEITLILTERIRSLLGLPPAG